MSFFTNAIDVLQTLVIALGGGLCVWGGINLLEGYGQDKVLFGLTKRQVICFGAAALVGVPLFFLAKASLGTTTAALCMILVMLPFFLFAMYEKNGQPLEVFLGHLIQNKFIRPKVRIYQTNNLYSALVRQSQLEQEVKRIARKGRKTGKA